MDFSEMEAPRIENLIAESLQASPDPFQVRTVLRREAER